MIIMDQIINFIKETQSKEWQRFENQNPGNTEDAFCKKFNDAVIADGILHVLRHGFKHRGIQFKVCFFKPESTLNQLSAELYAKNKIECYRQWFYSATCSKSVDMILTVNGIPLVALEEFEERGKTDPLFAELDKIVKANGGLWCTEAEEYLLANGPKVN